MRIVVTGSSGLVGRSVVPDLKRHGHEVLRLVRSTEQAGASDAALWNPAAGELDPRLFAGADAVINLNGRNIGEQRWTPAVKAELRSSRLRPTRLIVDAIRRAGSRPPLLINASAVGYYGSRGEEILDEPAAVGEGFLAELAHDWEAAATAARDHGCRVVLLRLGMVIAGGGAIDRMLTPFKLGLGGPIGSGRQWWPWIAIDDVVEVIRFVLENPSIDGPLNLVSPQEHRCGSFTATLGRVLRRPAFLPLPAFAARAALGEMADALLLASVRARPAALERTGFEFTHPGLGEALRRVLP